MDCAIPEEAGLQLVNSPGLTATARWANKAHDQKWFCLALMCQQEPFLKQQDLASDSCLYHYLIKLLPCALDGLPLKITWKLQLVQTAC